MFRIHVFSPPLADELYGPHAGGELVVGTTRLVFRLDLSHWRTADYERQWKAGLARLVHGASTSALMTAFRGNGDAPHMMFALWREGRDVYVQPHCVLPAEIAARFDPFAPYVHVEARIPAMEQSLPMRECRVEIEQLLTSALGIKWPFGQ